MAARRCLVVGGSGFVGTRVVRAALRSGLKVISLSRSGAPSSSISLPGVEWRKGDVTNAQDVAAAVKDVDAVISCLGAFGSHSFMREINGSANASLAKIAAQTGVQRFAYISAQRFRPVEPLLHGYYDGKRAAEAAVSQHFGISGAILRPPAVYGTRQISPHVSLPLGVVGLPLTRLFSLPAARAVASALGPLGDLLCPWVSVDEVAGAAVGFIVSPRTKAEQSGTEPQKGSGAVEIDGDAIREAAVEFERSIPAAVTLFWDGGCPLCRKEIAHYKEIDTQRNVRWVDIHSDPSELQLHGIKLPDAMQFIHSIDAGGRVQVGIPAFLAVWEQLPRPWSWLPPLIRTTPFGLPIISAAYTTWAKHRLRITGRARALEETSACSRKD